MPVRVTAGEFKGIVLAAPKEIRASEAKVRLALFNILGEFIHEARVLDGFAGSGALGIEALSRGASFAAFVDSDTESVLSIRQNLERLADELPREVWRVLHMDLERAIPELAKSEPPFDLILLDPPYRSDEGKKALNAIVQCAILAPAGLVVVEHHQRTVLPTVIGPLQHSKRHRYGDTVLSFYWRPSGP